MRTGEPLVLSLDNVGPNDAPDVTVRLSVAAHSLSPNASLRLASMARLLAVVDA